MPILSFKVQPGMLLKAAAVGNIKDIKTCCPEIGTILHHSSLFGYQPKAA